jgi:hypothetical protein
VGGGGSPGEKEREGGGREGEGRRTKSECPGKGWRRVDTAAAQRTKFWAVTCAHLISERRALERFRCCQPRACLSGDSRRSCWTTWGEPLPLGQHHFWSVRTITDVHHKQIVGAGVKRFLLGIWKHSELEGVWGVHHAQFEVAETREQVFVGP